MDYDGLLELVKNTRSIRRFKPDPVPEELVEKVIEVGRWAPSGFNSQPWEFVVVRKKELKDKIVSYINEYWPQSARMEATREPWQRTISRSSQAPDDYRTAPVFILLFGDTRAKMGLPMALRHDDARCQKIHISSLGNAFLYMHLAATSLCLAFQWFSGIQSPLSHCLTKDLLGIPMEFEVFDMLALGYPALKPRPKLMRDRAKMVHYDYCGPESFRAMDEVKDYIKKTRTWVISSMARKPD